MRSPYPARFSAAAGLTSFSLSLTRQARYLLAHGRRNRTHEAVIHFILRSRISGVILLVDETFMNHLGELALREGDYLLGQIFYSLNEDCRWHREWAAALVRMAIKDNSDNRGTLQGWIEKWHPDAARAVEAFAGVFDGGPESARMSVLDGIPWKLGEFYREYLARMSLRPPAREGLGTG
jgi:hypothetical protein